MHYFWLPCYGGRECLLRYRIARLPLCSTDSRENSEGRFTSIRRVDLIDPASGKSLDIEDAAGRSIRANVIVQASYTTGVTVHR